MAMTEIYSGIQQTSPYSCGAASCLFILKMLGQDKSGQTDKHVMKKTSTWGPCVQVGSTPYNIARYIEHRCKQRPGGVTIRRLGGSTPSSRPWLHALTPAVSTYPKFTDAPDKNDVILRCIVPQSFDVTAHFVVQTHFGDLHSKIMDPQDGDIEILSFNDYLANENYQSTGLDLVISG
jgi:hypothetical protein